MKKLLILLAVLVVAALLISVSCSPKEGKEGDVSTSRRVKTIQHDDHLFVVFKGYESVAMIHHPGCECLK